MNKDKKRIVLVAAALPYANGSLHLGHVAGFIGADFVARYHRLKGDKVMFVSGADCYGTPISIKAAETGVDPKEIALKYAQEFKETLADGLGMSYDLFSKTLNPEHHKVAQELFLDLYSKGHIYKQMQKLPYCETCQRFLADRYIEGKCPKCGFNNARGDQCDDCGSLLDAKDLIDSKCKLCGRSPVWKETEHFFLKLSAFAERIANWVGESKGWRQNAKNFTAGLLKIGVHDRAISRDSSWGIPIPIEGYENKIIYVWFEAVCGYLSASKEHSLNIGQPDLWREFWENNDAIHYYFHGKDNIPFHTVVWPSILMGVGGLTLPTKVYSSEYLIFEGKQFSKSRNWGIWLPEFLEKYHPDTLRFYLGISGPENADANFTLGDFQARCNSDLIGKFGNFVNRVISFTNSKFNGKVPHRSTLSVSDKKVLERCKNIFEEIGVLIEDGKFQKAFKGFIEFTEEANKYINDRAPWKIIKEDIEDAATAINVSLQIVSTLQVLVTPLLPFSAEKIREQLNIEERGEWRFYEIKEGHALNEAVPLYQRIEVGDVNTAPELV